MSSSAASAGIGSDRSTISQIEHRIESEGQRAQQLVAEYNRVELRLLTIHREIAGDRTRLALEERQARTASVRLRHLAVAAYVEASGGGSASFLSTSNAATLPEQEVYLGVASGSIVGVTTELQDARHRAVVTGSALRSAESSTLATLHQLAAAHEQAQQATLADQSALEGVSAHLQHLILAAQQRAAAKQEAATEKRLATAVSAPPTPVPTPTATAPTSTPSSGGYENPLRAIGGLGANRIDQGVDYDGSGPIYALGDGVILSTSNGGWPGGTYITYELTDGPAQGLVVYAAEDINPEVSVGESVTPNTVIGQVYGGPTGIEVGWANGSLGDTMAAAYGQFGGDNSTAFGANFSQLLTSLGAPGGSLQNAPSGSLPANWPQW